MSLNYSASPAIFYEMHCTVGNHWPRRRKCQQKTYNLKTLLPLGWSGGDVNNMHTTTHLKSLPVYAKRSFYISLSLASDVRELQQSYKICLNLCSQDQPMVFNYILQFLFHVLFIIFMLKIEMRVDLETCCSVITLKLYKVCIK